MDIVKKVQGVKGQRPPEGGVRQMKQVSAQFSRPGSSYVLQTQALHEHHRTQVWSAQSKEFKIIGLGETLSCGCC